MASPADEELDVVHLSIPVAPLLEAFVCSICLNEITDCHITPCGHNFCLECIRECLDRRHRCPLCTREATKEQLIKNTAWDSLQERVSQERVRAEKAYVNGLMNSAKRPVGQQLGSQPSPIEQIFAKHAQQTLVAFEAHYQEVKGESERKRLQLRAEYSAKLELIRAGMAAQMGLADVNDSKAAGADALPAPVAVPFNRTKSQEQATARAMELKDEYQKALGEVNVAFDHAVKLLVEAFEGVMSHIPASPFLLPVACTIRFVDRPLRFDVSLKSTQTLQDVLEVVAERAKGMGDGVTHYGDDVRFDIKRPFGDAPSGDETKTVSDRSVTVAELRLSQGSELLIRGHVEFHSDTKNECFTIHYDADNAEQRIDYYRCETCGFNWICSTCAKSCHKDHKTVMFMPNHKPSYACCYCAKKKKCSLMNYRTVKKK